MSMNLCIGKPVQYFMECDRNNPCPALVNRIDGEGMLVLNVFNGPFHEYRMSVRHVSDPVLKSNENLIGYGCWDFLPEDKKSPLDIVPIGTDLVGGNPPSPAQQQPEDKKSLPEPKRK